MKNKNLMIKGKKLRAILITKEENKIARMQIFPFYLYKKELKEKFGLIFDEIKIRDNSDKLSNLNIDFSKYDIMFVQRRALRNDIKFLKSIKIKKVFLDEFPSSGEFLYDVFPYVDLYLKKQFLKDFNLYKRSYLGENYHADYLIKLYKIKEKYKKSQLLKDKDKLILGWSYLISQGFYNVLGKLKYRPYRWLRNFRYFFIKRKIDINCRVQLISNNFNKPMWYHLHRFSALRNLEKLKDKYKIIATNKFLSKRLYFKELKKSKICVSPFGLGELCLRDFEAMICKSLLIKPSIGHLIIEPKIFIPNKTYVPIKWDLSDLNEKCEYFLSHDKERKEIIKNAEKVLTKYFEEKKFIKKIGEILHKLGFEE